MIKRLLLIALLSGFVPMAQAHDPGLSRASIQLLEAEITIHLVFARQDVELLVPMDTDHDGAVTPNEFSAVLGELRSKITHAVTVKQSGKILFPKFARVDLVTSDAVNAELYYDYTETGAVNLKIPLIAQLARGHRQYLTVQDARGKLLAQHILDATSPPVLLEGMDGNGPGRLGVFREYLGEGVWHIWLGFDHILFLLTLLLPAVLVYREQRWSSVGRLRPAMVDVLKTVTAFTVAHSITLALAVLDIVSLPPRLVESAIAFSVLVTAVNNLWPVFPASRWLLALGFGLLHGFGFASVLMELGLPGDALAISLLGFNIGVEAGQLAIVILVLPVAACLRHTPLYRTWVFNGGSAMAALIAMVWMFERMFDYEVAAF